LAVGLVVGNDGFIHVTKNLKIRDVFTSSAHLQTGEIAEDFTYYFAVSEQIPSSVGLGVLVNESNEVFASGGFILQVMPGAKEETLQKIEANIQIMKPISELIAQGNSPEDIINLITHGDHEFVEELQLAYECDCNRSRFEKGLISLGKKELEEMIMEDKPIEIVCHFCNSKYDFSVDELEDLIKESN